MRVYVCRLTKCLGLDLGTPAGNKSGYMNCCDFDVSRVYVPEAYKNDRFELCIYVCIRIDALKAYFFAKRKNRVQKMVTKIGTKN